MSNKMAASAITAAVVILKSAVVWFVAWLVLILAAHILVLCAFCIGIYVDDYKLLWFIFAFIFSLYVGNMGMYLIGRCVHKQNILGHRILFGNQDIVDS